jgi:hypothetical protein
LQLVELLDMLGSLGDSHTVSADLVIEDGQIRGTLKVRPRKGGQPVSASPAARRGASANGTLPAATADRRRVMIARLRGDPAAVGLPLSGAEGAAISENPPLDTTVDLGADVRPAGTNGCGNGARPANHCGSQGLPASPTPSAASSPATAPAVAGASGDSGLAATEESYRALKNLGVDHGQALRLAGTFSSARISEVVAASLTKNSPAGYAVVALAKNWRVGAEGHGHSRDRPP